MSPYIPWQSTGVDPERCDFTWLFVNQCDHCRSNHTDNGLVGVVYTDDKAVTVDGSGVYTDTDGRGAE